MTPKSQWLTTVSCYILTDIDENWELALALLHVFLILEPRVMVEPPSQPSLVQKEKSDGRAMR